MKSTVALTAALLLLNAASACGTTSAELALAGPPVAAVIWGQNVDVIVKSTHNERMATCAYRLEVGGTAALVLTERTIANGLNYLNADITAPLDDGVPTPLTPGESLEEVLIHLDPAGPPGNPLDGLAPGVQVPLAIYRFVATRAGMLTLTLTAPRAAETQTDPGGAMFEMVTVASGFAVITLTVSGGPDAHADGHVDLRDFAVLQRCLEQNPTGACAPADADADGDVDSTDFEIVQDCLAGPTSIEACSPVTRQEDQP